MFETHASLCALSAMLESRKKDDVYDCPAIAYSQPCMFFLFMVTFYHAHDISYKGKLTNGIFI